MRHASCEARVAPPLAMAHHQTLGDYHSVNYPFNKSSGMPMSWIAVASLAGCTTTPTAQSVAGFYVSAPVLEDSTHSTELTLELAPDGKYFAWQRTFSNGEAVRISALVAYDLHSNSQGVWRYANHDLYLTSEGPCSSLGYDKQSLAKIAPQQSVAKVLIAGPNASLEWDGVRYAFSGKVPEQWEGPAKNQLHFSGVP